MFSRKSRKTAAEEVKVQEVEEVEMGEDQGQGRQAGTAAKAQTQGPYIKRGKEGTVDRELRCNCSGPKIVVHAGRMLYKNVTRVFTRTPARLAAASGRAVFKLSLCRWTSWSWRCDVVVVS